MEKTTSSVIWSSKSFHWRIRNFSDISGLERNASNDENDNNNELFMNQNSQEYNCLLDIDFLQSPEIDVGRTGADGYTKWLIKMMKSTEDENSIDIHMEFVEGESEFENDGASFNECFFKYRIVILGNNEQPFIKRDTSKIIFLKSGNSWCEPAILSLDQLRDSHILKDDTLNLQIDLFVLNDLHHSRVDELATQVAIATKPEFEIPFKKRKYNSYSNSQEILDSCQLQLSKHVLSNLWKARICSDATIECGDTQFPVHESVLSSASPVFAAAFVHDMSEKLEKRIVVRDLSPTTVENILRFIYCDTNIDEPQWRNMNELTSLLNAAEKYQIIPLKSLVFSRLCEELTLNNAAHITSLVYLFKPEEKVKELIYQYVIRNISILKGMESFKTKLNELPAAFTPLLLMIGE